MGRDYFLADLTPQDLFFLPDIYCSAKTGTNIVPPVIPFICTANPNKLPCILFGTSCAGVCVGNNTDFDNANDTDCENRVRKQASINLTNTSTVIGGNSTIPFAGFQPGCYTDGRYYANKLDYCELSKTYDDNVNTLPGLGAPGATVTDNGVTRTVTPVYGYLTRNFHIFEYLNTPTNCGTNASPNNDGGVVDFAPCASDLDCFIQQYCVVPYEAAFGVNTFNMNQSTCFVDQTGALKHVDSVYYWCLYKWLNDVEASPNNLVSEATVVIIPTTHCCDGGPCDSDAACAGAFSTNSLQCCIDDRENVNNPLGPTTCDSNYNYYPTDSAFCQAKITAEGNN